MTESFSKEVRNELANDENDEKKLDKSRVYVRTCFLRNGVISNPTSTYHLEFTLQPDEAVKLTDILKRFGLSPKETKRGNSTLLYFKDSDAIAEVLRIIKAPKSLIEFEKLRIEKSIRGDINRKVNFETANLSKTANAAAEQLEAIKFIARTTGLSYLSSGLEEVARLRLENENLSLTEIGRLLSVPVSKSGVNHRLRKIINVAKNLEMGED